MFQCWQLYCYQKVHRQFVLLWWLLQTVIDLHFVVLRQTMNFGCFEFVGNLKMCNEKMQNSYRLTHRKGLWMLKRHHRQKEIQPACSDCLRINWKLCLCWWRYFVRISFCFDYSVRTSCFQCQIQNWMSQMICSGQTSG